MYHVTFKDGGMTKIHIHESEQVLIATTNLSEHTPVLDMGRGFVVLIKMSNNSATNNDPQFNINMPIFLDRVGDTICIPRNVLHCHGSRSKEQNFSHIAIRRSTLDNGMPAKTVWEYQIEEMKKVMRINNDSKVSSIFDKLHDKIKTIIS